jgi:hypothetical protein
LLGTKAKIWIKNSDNGVTLCVDCHHDIHKKNKIEIKIKSLGGD